MVVELSKKVTEWVKSNPIGGRNFFNDMVTKQVAEKGGAHMFFLRNQGFEVSVVGEVIEVDFKR